jgi:hypothetical protein
VFINYTGKGKGKGVVIQQLPVGGGPVSAKSPLYITGAKFTPSIGAPGDPDYKRARLTLTLRTNVTTTISKIDVDVLSEPFTNPGVLTNSNSKNSPIVILKEQWKALGGSYQILPDKDNAITFNLSRTSKKAVQEQEDGPGIYSPADWGYAFGQTTTASFHWTVTSPTGNLSGTFTQSPKKAWMWP